MVKRLRVETGRMSFGRSKVIRPRRRSALEIGREALALQKADEVKPLPIECRPVAWDKVDSMLDDCKALLHESAEALSGGTGS